jgi:hypothetical protein
MGSIPGVIVGGLIIQGFPELIRWFAQNYLGGTGIADTIADLRMLLLGLFMIVMMAVRTEGLIPSKQIKRELKDSDFSEDICPEDKELEDTASLQGSVAGGGGGA